MKIFVLTTTLSVCVACGDSTAVPDPATDAQATTAASAECTYQHATGAGTSPTEMSTEGNPSGTGGNPTGSEGNTSGVDDTPAETGDSSSTFESSELDCTVFEQCWGDRWREAYGLDGFDTVPDCSVVYVQFCQPLETPCDRHACGMDCFSEREAIEWDCANNHPGCGEQRSEELRELICETEFQDRETLCGTHCIDVDPIQCHREANLALSQCLEGTR